MQIDVVNSVIIKRSVAEVFQYAADPDHAPQWYENIRSVDGATIIPKFVGESLKSPERNCHAQMADGFRNRPTR